MPNNYFRFKQFTVLQEQSAMKVCTDASLFGAWIARKHHVHGSNILDIGSGTGLLSLMLAQKSAAHIDAIDIDESASAETRKNFNASAWQSRLNIIQAAIQDYRPGKRYDFIISNPPFFRGDLLSPDQKRNVALHSASLSMDELFAAVNELIEANGHFALLVSARREEDVEQTASKHEFGIMEKVYVRQTPKHAPFRIMYLFYCGRRSVNAEHKRYSGEPKVNEIVIRISSGKMEVYSPEFTALLKDYYLYL